MRLLKPLTAMLLVPVLFLAGCGGGASTPEAAFEGFKTAMQNEDFETGFTYLTPESQDMLLSVVMIPIGMMKAFGQSPPELDAVLEKHGIDLENGGDDALANVKNKGACFQDLLNVMKEEGGDDAKENPFAPDELKTATLTDVKIDGDSATGKAAGETMHFTKIDGKWLIDMKKSMEAQMGDMNMDMGDMPGPGDLMQPPGGEGDTPALDFPDPGDAIPDDSPDSQPETPEAPPDNPEE